MWQPAPGVVLPLCADRAAFRLLANARRSSDAETLDHLIMGAVAISMHQLKNVDLKAVYTKLQFYADVVRGRVRGSQPQAIIAHLHEVLFEEEGFAVDDGDYYNPANSYLPVTLETKRGLPITLSLVYRAVAARLGMKVWGLPIPGHYLCGIDIGGSPTLIDQGDRGRLLTQDEVIKKVSSTLGDEAAASEELFMPDTNRNCLTRMCQNLLTVFGANGHYADVVAMLELEMALWPDETRLLRDLGITLTRVAGMNKPAKASIQAYLQKEPDDPQRTKLDQLVHALGG